ncbi:MAG: MerR family DNA-binding transcriptional regulator [Thiolinea sp.]
MSKPQKTYLISELAKEFGVTTRTIRLYEEQNLLSPQREGNKRIYSEGDRVRLRLTLRAKRLGMTLAEAKELIDLYYDGRNKKHQLEKLLEKLREREDKLLEQRADIDLTLLEIERIKKQAEEALKEQS